MPTFSLTVSQLLQSDFDFGLTAADYPIFDEEYRAGLNKKILDHYWNYEIGQETPGMFRFALNRKLREIMPLYNQLYQSTKIEFDPLSTMKYEDVTAQTGHGTVNSTASNESSSTTNSKSRVVSSDTPQTMLAGNEDYASGASDSNGESETTATGSGTTAQTTDSNGNVTHSMSGYQGAASVLLMQYRQSLMNIDMNVINELGSLFMGLWDNGDTFTENEGSLSYGWSFDLGRGWPL